MIDLGLYCLQLEKFQIEMRSYWVLVIFMTARSEFLNFYIHSYPHEAIELVTHETVLEPITSFSF